MKNLSLLFAISIQLLVGCQQKAQDLSFEGSWVYKFGAPRKDSCSQALVEDQSLETTLHIKDLGKILEIKALTGQTIGYLKAQRSDNQKAEATILKADTRLNIKADLFLKLESRDKMSVSQIVYITILSDKRRCEVHSGPVTALRR